MIAVLFILLFVHIAANVCPSVPTLCGTIGVSGVNDLNESIRIYTEAECKSLGGFYFGSRGNYRECFSYQDMETSFNYKCRGLNCASVPQPRPDGLIAHYFQTSDCSGEQVRQKIIAAADDSCDTVNPILTSCTAITATIIFSRSCPVYSEYFINLKLMLLNVCIPLGPGSYILSCESYTSSLGFRKEILALQGSPAIVKKLYIDNDCKTPVQAVYSVDPNCLKTHDQSLSTCSNYFFNNFCRTNSDPSLSMCSGYTRELCGESFPSFYSDTMASDNTTTNIPETTVTTLLLTSTTNSVTILPESPNKTDIGEPISKSTIKSNSNISLYVGVSVAVICSLLTIYAFYFYFYKKRENNEYNYGDLELINN